VAENRFDVGEQLRELFPMVLEAICQTLQILEVGPDGAPQHEPDVVWDFSPSG
jgi:hypothetical protein